MTSPITSVIVESMSTELHTADARAALHAALADPHRLAIVDELALSDRSPSELSATLELGSNLLAHHLGVLDKVGLVERVESRADRRRRYLRLKPATLGALMQPHRLEARRLLFVCTANSARSQLATALWNASHTVGAESAGTEPGERVHPDAVRAGRRLGVDLTEARPRRLGDLKMAAHVLVVTVCDRAHEQLADSLAAPLLHWSIEDPAEVGGRAAFHQAAREIDERVRELAPLVAPVP